MNNLLYFRFVHLCPALSIFTARYLEKNIMLEDTFPKKTHYIREIHGKLKLLPSMEVIYVMNLTLTYSNIPVVQVNLKVCIYVVYFDIFK